MADHSCSNKRSMERVGKVNNANKAKKCNTTCDLIPLSEINSQHHKRTHNSLTCRLLFLNWSIHLLLESRHTSFTNDPFYRPALVKSCSLVKIKIPYPATFPLRFSHPDAVKTQNPVSALNWNSRFPLLFSAPIPNIATKISQIPHPAKTIVDPLTLSVRRGGNEWMSELYQRV